MPSINIYKITQEKKDEMFLYLDEAYDCLSECTQEYEAENVESKSYNVKLYFSEKDHPNDLKWNWALSMFGQEKRQIYGSPKGVMTLSSNTECYALTFGSSSN